MRDNPMRGLFMDLDLDLDLDFYHGTNVGAGSPYYQATVSTSQDIHQWVGFRVRV